jgi:hypothetical protein
MLRWQNDLKTKTSKGLPSAHILKAPVQLAEGRSTPNTFAFLKNLRQQNGLIETSR